MTESAYCQRHPGTPTNLRCGRCETTICPDCMVYAPVGARCPDCAKTAPLPMFDVSNVELAKAIAVSSAIAIGGGIAIALLAPLLFGYVVFIVFDLLEVGAFAVVGYLVGEITSRSMNEKRGMVLQYVVAGAMVASCFSLLLTLGSLSLSTLLGAVVGGYLAVSRFRI